MPKNEKKEPADAQQEPKKSDEPKIIVDDDWKVQAAVEKQKLAEQVESKASPSEAEPAAEGPTAQGPRELPPASFATLVSSVAMQGLLALGGYEDPKTKKRLVDLTLAKHHIDTLSVLEEKTKGNLTDEEKKALDKALYETRMQYVQFAQRFGSS